ncbi:MAG: hypothetical protein QM820_11420 [Minicystis sp.]
MRRAALFLCLAAAGCDSAPGIETTCDFPALDRTVLVLERSDQTSALARLAGGCFAEAPSDLALGADQYPFAVRGRAFVGVNDRGSLHEIDVDALSFRTTFDVYADHPKPDRPHGIYGVDVDASGDLWVSRDDVASLVVVKPNGKLDVVDLSDLDPDGIPDMNGVLVRDGKAFVALGFLPAWNTPAFGDHATRAGAVAVIDVATRTRLDVIDLIGHNPVHALVPTADPDVVVVATPGAHDELASEDGVERVWLDGSRKTEQVIDEKELGGSVEEVVWGSDTEAYAIVLGPEPGLNPTRVVAFDPSKPAGQRVTRELAKAPWFADAVNGAAYVHAGLALAKDHVIVGDHTPGAPGLRIFARQTGAEVAFIPARNAAPWALVALDP